MSAVPGGSLVPERRPNCLKSKGGIVQKSALLSPSRIVVEGLKDNTIDIDGMLSCSELSVDARVEIFGEVHADIEEHARELFLKGVLQFVLTVILISSMPTSNDTTLRDCGMVDLLERSGLGLETVVEAKNLIVGYGAHSEKDQTKEPTHWKLARLSGKQTIGKMEERKGGGDSYRARRCI